MPDDAEMLAARLARMQHLIKELEQACSDSEQQRQKFLHLYAELDAARAVIKRSNR